MMISVLDLLKRNSYPVEMQTIVEFAVHQINKVICGYRHDFCKNLHSEFPHCGLEYNICRHYGLKCTLQL